MINHLKTLHEIKNMATEEYENLLDEFLIWLEKEIADTCGTSKLSQRLGKSNSYVAAHFNRKKADLPVWIKMHDEMVAMNEEKARLLR